MDPQGRPQLSYDVLTLIIDQLGSERCYNELNAWSQTCQMFLLPCRIYLFSTVNITGLNSGHFADLLEANSTIPDFVQELILDFHLYNTDKDLAKALLLLNNVKTLSVYDQYSNWTILAKSTQRGITHLLGSPSINSFFMTNVYDFPATLLSSSSTLKHLTVTNCRITYETANRILTPPPQLLSLNLSKHYVFISSVALPNVKRIDGLPLLGVSGLRSLVVDVCNSHESIHLESILRLTAKLDHLECSGLTMISDSFVQSLTIVSSTLRSLKLIWRINDRPLDVVLGLIKILEGLALQPNCIDELFIILTRTAQSDLLDLDWEAFDQLLANRSSFPRFKKLTIQIFQEAEMERNFEDVKATKFPRLSLATNEYLDFTLTHLDDDDYYIVI